MMDCAFCSTRRCSASASSSPSCSCAHRARGSGMPAGPAGAPAPLVHFGLVQGASGGAHGGKPLAKPLKQRRRLARGKPVEQRKVPARVQQRLVLVLAVDIHQQVAHLLERRGGNQRPVDAAHVLPASDSSRESTSSPSSASSSSASSTSNTGSPGESRNVASTAAFCAPVRISSRLPRSPSTKFSASMMIDLPAPVSPVKAENPASTKRTGAR